MARIKANLLQELKDFIRYNNQNVLNKGLRIFEKLDKDALVFDDNGDEYSIGIPSETSSKIYDVTLFNDEEIGMHGMCDCPVNEYNDDTCKHQIAAALLLEYQQKGQSAKVLKAELTKVPKKPEPTESGFFIFPSIILDTDLIEASTTTGIGEFEREIWRSWNCLLKEEPEWKRISLKYDGKFFPSATFISNHQIKLECSCKDINTNNACKHAVTLLLLISRKFHKGYFRRYDDLTQDKNKLLAPFGLTTENKLAASFAFGFDYFGNFVITRTPEYIFNTANEDRWKLLKNRLSVLQKPMDAKQIITTEEFDKITLFLILSPQSEPHLKLELLGIRSKKNGKGLLYKKLSTRDQNLALLEASQKELIPILQMISIEKMEQMLVHKSGNWDYLPSKYKAQWILKLRKAFQMLSELETPPELMIQLADKSYQAMYIGKGKPQISFKLFLEANYIEFAGFISFKDGEKIPMSETHYFPWFLLQANDCFYLIDDEMIELVSLFSKSNLFIPFHEFEKLQSEIIQPLSEKYPVEYDASLNIIEEEAELLVPGMEISLSELNNEYLLLTPKWHYGKVVLGYDQADITRKESGLVAIKRNKEVEAEYKLWMQSLYPAFLHQRQSFFHLPIKEALKNQWYFDFVQKAKEKEVILTGIEKLHHFNFNTAIPTLNMKVGGGIDWFDVEIEVFYGDLVVSLAELKKAILASQKFITLSDGSLGVIPEEWIARYGYLLKSAKMKDGALQVSKFQWTLIDDLYDQLSDDKVAEELKRKRELLQNIDKENVYAIPKKVKASLRDYQKSGFQWLCMLDSLEWGGCLADDMGLGKTLQALTFLAHLNTKEKNTHLIVCPTSLIYNWESEIKKFTKHLKYHIHYGSEREENMTHFSDYDIIITSYGMLRSDIKEFNAFKFSYVILDESHAIKNPASQIAKAVGLLNCKNKVAMSGTPLQNNTMDIYSQMNFLNPGMLGSMDSFKSEFATPIDKHGDKERVEMLRKMLYPFMLRRTKEQVAKDLPDKTETILWCEMESEQRKIYNSFKEYYRKLILNKIDEEGMNKSSFFILEGLLKLRQICDSPAILNEEVKYPNESVKIEELVRELEENTGSHKALVFSQFVTMLKLVEAELIKREIPYIYLDGQTKAADRKKIVNQFQDNAETKVMLISLKAGGVGLNLTAADYVYLIDPWWNPAIEQQAIDRTHRIGQTQKVFAYKMICKDSIEEKILLLQDKKKSLSADIISGETSFVKKLTRDDIQYLFS